MPRGIPNAKRDDSGMRYTSMHVPLASNPKQLGASYLKSESQTLWARNAAKKQKLPAEDVPAPSPDQRRGSHVIVIHPGSRWLRIGKASEVTPVSLPNVIARKHKLPIPEPTFVEGIMRPRSRTTPPSSTPQPPSGDEYAVAPASDDPFEEKLASITVSLRERMRFYKLRVTQNATSIASTFNEQFRPEIIPEANDPFRVEWIHEPDKEYLIGEQVLRISDPRKLGYSIRWPIHGHNFNTRDYPSVQMILDDIETIVSTALFDKYGLTRGDYKVRAYAQNYSVVLVIPDFYDRAYVREFESLAATYGAGISNACVVDVGAVCASVACVDEGLVIPDSRISLNMGGNDITEFLYVLLERINFPYRSANLTLWHDWLVIEDLKARLCTLAEGDVALNLYDFVVRRYGKPTEKYGLRAYDEIILAPMCIFEPRVIEFDRKRIGSRSIFSSDVTEEIIEHPADHVVRLIVLFTVTGRSPLPSETGAKLEQQEISLPSSANPTPPPTALPTGESVEVSNGPVEVDMEGEEKTAQATQPPHSAQQVRLESVPSSSSYPGGLPIDVCFEASKLPLDYLQAVLVVGGSAHIPGMAHALESRLQAIATPLVPNMEKVQIIPPPKDVDPKVLAWKGAAVLAKMDSVADLWLTCADWDMLGMRGLKERCFYLC
ncbi:hypothetical protein EDD16DRAFT_1686093 [Pisolithus croceorrhizus]|nr:hypothetical protein EDD16DRAFT_1686093 [Pisolithus croceorrhizus]